MAYVKGSTILASDFNGLAGLTGAAAASAVVAQNKAGYLYGVGFGDRGYGQTTPALEAVTAGQTIGQEWQNLRTVIASMAAWQNTSTALLPPASSFNAGTGIVAHEADAPSSNAFDINGLIALLDTNRLNYQLANMTLVSNAVSSTRSTTWGAGNSGITCEFSVTFASEDAARYFFNTGGEIRIGASHPNTSTPRNQTWNTVLNGFSAAFRANSSARIGGSYGTAQAIGYYQLTTAYQTIIDGTNTGISPYTINDFYVDARATSITGLNGAKGAVLHFRVRLIDEQTNAFSDIVNSGTFAGLSHLRATTSYTQAAPATAVVTAFG